MKKLALIGAAAAIAATGFVAPAQAIGGYCNGQYDAVCTDRSDPDRAMCTLWVNWRCSVGE